MTYHSLRKRSSSKTRRGSYIYYISLLMLGCMSAFLSFSITLYATSDYIIDYVSYMFLPSPNVPVFHLSPHEMIKYYITRDFSGKKQSIYYDYYIGYNDFNYRKPETLTYKSRIYANNTEILFRIPRKTSVSALLLIFHSCRHSAADWFHTPERQRIIGAAIDLGYVCLVFQATDKTTKCWSNNADIYANNDVQMILEGLDDFYKDYPVFALLPRFTFGSSSGGILSSIFAINQQYPIQGQIIFTSIILPEILYTYVKPKNYPPTAWIHMLRDIDFASESRISVSKQIFIEHKIPCNTFPIEPVKLIATTFRDRIPSVTRATSRYIYYQLQQSRWLNYHNYLFYNPRRQLSWRGVVFPSTDNDGKDRDLVKNLNDNKDKIIEFFNTIYGEHEISYERSFEALKWLKEVYTSSQKSD